MNNRDSDIGPLRVAIIGPDGDFTDYGDKMYATLDGFYGVRLDDEDEIIEFPEEVVEYVDYRTYEGNQYDTVFSNN